jgi:hyperosmotically inducible periplasmic protein
MITRFACIALVFSCLSIVGCQSTTGKTAGQSLDDATITASVQSKLTSDRLANFSRIDVDTEHGIVTLNGVVKSVDQKSRAAEMAREVKGVRSVNNNLQIQQP